MLAAAACVVMSRELVGLVYEHGRFTAADTATVAAILSVLALAVPAWIGQQIAVRAFYARGDTWRPMLLGTVVAVAAIPLYMALGRRFGVLGLAAAGFLGMTVNALATISLAHWLHGAPPLGALLVSAARAAVIAVAAGAGASLVTIDPLPVSMGGMLANLFVKGLVFAAIALAGIPTIGGEAMRDTMRRVLRRRR
jgi:putative peptidoglycan lipid II flippase